MIAFGIGQLSCAIISFIIHLPIQARTMNVLETSEVHQIRQPQLRSHCESHPGFDFDTICFSQACKSKGKQIICQYCTHQESHISHMNQQFPIYRTSPGFRSIDFTKDWHKLPQIMRLREKTAEEFINLKTYFNQLIDKMADYSLKKLQCLSELLTKNGVVKVCRKIRQNYKNHLECCVKAINDLYVHQEGNILSKEDAYKLIEHNLRNECSAISNKIERLKMKVFKLFDRQDQRASFQVKAYTNMENNYITQNIEHGLRDHFTGFCIAQPNLSPYQLNNFQVLNGHEGSQDDNQQSFINELTIFEQQQSHSNQPETAIKNAWNKKPPIGVDLETQGIITVWDANPSALNYLRNCKVIKNLIIEDVFLTNTKQFQSLIKDLPQLQGIHINCRYSISQYRLMNVKVSYLNLFPSFRFIQSTDRSKYFSKVQWKMPDILLSTFIKPVYLDSKYQKKNKYINSSHFKKIKGHLTQLNFIQNQSNQLWKLLRKHTYKFKNTKNLQILTFSNIFLHKNVCLNSVYKNNPQLHTIVFADCMATYKSLIYQLRQLNPKQLRHLQISGNGLEERIVLTAKQSQRIFSNLSLKTLILTNIIFVEEQGKQSSLLFQGISKLARLTHLNLYNSFPIPPKILQYLHKSCRKQLKYLNIGCSQITDKQRFYRSPPFSNLQSLCLDYTEINQAQLAIFMKNSVSLKYLSIQNLNGQKIESEETEQRENSKCYGLITPQFFMSLQSKSLKYVNIYNCFAFSEYSWERFDDLECIRVNEGLLSQRTIKILKTKGIKLNFVKKDQLLCSKIKSVKQSFRQLNEQSRAYSEDIDYWSEESGIESFSSDDKGEDYELELISNQGTLQRVANNKANILLSKGAKQGL